MQKRLIIGFIVLFLVLAVKDALYGGGSAVSATATSAHSESILKSGGGQLPVTRVIDGDTIEVLIDGISERVRLVGVDTPETVDPRKPVQCFGKEASDFTKSLLENKYVRLEADSSQDNRDKYGRLLRYVYQGDTLINKEIILGGYGHEYTYLIPYQYQKDFKDAQKQAQVSQIGLWRPGVC